MAENDHIIQVQLVLIAGIDQFDTNRMRLIGVDSY